MDSSPVHEETRPQLLFRMFKHMPIESGKRVRTETGYPPPSGVDPVGGGRGSRPSTSATSTVRACS